MYIRDNYYLRDILRKTKNHARNSKMNEFVGECEKIDAIQDYHAFKGLMVDYRKKQPENVLLMQSEFGGEGLLYGHRNAFFEYAGAKDAQQRFIFPYFEHGADLRETGILSIRERGYHSFVFQSPYKNEMVHRERPMSPVYNVGPYILYAKPYYHKDVLLKIKKKNEKTALLFPAHTFEGAAAAFDKKKFVKEVFAKFKDEYDTILISVYWNDVTDPLYAMFEASGAKLVSAGFRGDPKFIQRQRAMLELSDVAASNLTGSYIGYALALDKPFFMFRDRATLVDLGNVGSDQEERRYAHTIDDIFRAFSSLNPTEEEMGQQRRIYERFWGGSRYFKTQEEAGKIIALSWKLLNGSGKTTKGYERAIFDALNGKNKAGLSEEEKILLRGSLGMEEEINNGGEAK